MMNKNKITEFNNIVLRHYADHGRHMLPWRLPESNGLFDPYKIFVSELMLQQTQVPRVVPKFEQFMDVFPNTYALAHATLAEVLAVWNGLGYNRRAKFLWQSSQQIEHEGRGTFPASKEGLISLPGVGVNTAGAIMAYAYNQPTTFIETNIRSVFIHHFFKDQASVSDADILDILEDELPKDSPRVWYWAIMDYGTYLKQTVGNTARTSKNYAKQSTFAGSRRQLRGQIIKLLLERPRTLAELKENIGDQRLMSVMEDLAKESMIRHAKGVFTIFDA